MSFLERLVRLVARLETTLSLVAAVLVAAIMVIVGADVAMRYALNRPFGWSYDLVSLYLTLAAFYFCLSRAFSGHVHVGVDILHYYVGPRTRRTFALVACIASLPLFALITYACGERAAIAWRHHDVLAGAIAWPTSISLALAPLGAGVLTARLAVDAAAHLAALLGYVSPVALPTLARSDEGLEQAHYE